MTDPTDLVPADIVRPHAEDLYAAELAAFVQAVRNGKPSPVDPEGSAHVTRVTFAAVESMRSGLPVRF